MKFYENFAENGFHASVMTTFSVDLQAYEDIALRRLRRAGCRQNVLLADRYALAEELARPEGGGRLAGREYRLIPRHAIGAYHLKILLRIGPDKAKLTIGSANATPAGMAGNLELFGSVECLRKEDDGERRLIEEAWSRLSRELGEDDVPAPLRTDHTWLVPRRPEGSTSQMRDGSTTALLWSGSPGIGAAFTEKVDDGPVRRLVVHSPYWDGGMNAFDQLQQRLAPEISTILVDPRTTLLFPRRTAFPYELRDIGKWCSGRFPHAKLVLARTDTYDHLLYGSANCTMAGMAADHEGGVNAEVSVYRRLPKGGFDELLDPDEILLNAPLLEASALHPSSPIEEAEILRGPKRTGVSGKFRLLDRTLDCELEGQDRSVELLLKSEKHGPPIGDPLPLTSSRKRVPIGMDGGLVDWVVVREESGSLSVPVPVEHPEVLARASRPSGSRKLEDMLLRLDERVHSSELLDLLDLLVRETETIKANRSVRSPLPATLMASETASSTARTLSYEEFTKRRADADPLHAGPNSLSGTAAYKLHAFLKVVSPVSSTSEPQTRGDHGGHGRKQSEADRGENVGTDMPPAASDDAQEQRNVRDAGRIRGTVDRLYSHVRNTDYESDTAHPSMDLLRLRALLHLVRRTGRRKELGQDDAQFLPRTGEGAWPMLIGRLLFPFFGHRPALFRMGIEVVDGGLDENVMDALEAARSAIDDAVANADGRDKHYLRQLAVRVEAIVARPSTVE